MEFLHQQVRSTQQLYNTHKNSDHYHLHWRCGCYHGVDREFQTCGKGEARLSLRRLAWLLLEACFRSTGGGLLYVEIAEIQQLEDYCGRHNCTPEKSAYVTACTCQRVSTCGETKQVEPLHEKRRGIRTNVPDEMGQKQAFEEVS